MWSKIVHGHRVQQRLILVIEVPLAARVQPGRKGLAEITPVGPAASADIGHDQGLVGSLLQPVDRFRAKLAVTGLVVRRFPQPQPVFGKVTAVREACTGGSGYTVKLTRALVPATQGVCTRGLRPAGPATTPGPVIAR